MTEPESDARMTDAEPFALVNDYIQQQQALIQAQLEQSDGGDVVLSIVAGESQTFAWESS